MPSSSIILKEASIIWGNKNGLSVIIMLKLIYIKLICILVAL